MVGENWQSKTWLKKRYINKKSYIRLYYKNSLVVWSNYLVYYYI